MAKLEGGRGFLYRLARSSAATKSSANDETSLFILKHLNYLSRHRRVDLASLHRLGVDDNATTTVMTTLQVMGPLCSTMLFNCTSQPLLLFGVTCSPR